MIIRNLLKEIRERLIHIEGKVDRLENMLYGINTSCYYKKSYAQHGKDVIIINLFKLLGIEKPSYIDIGDHHPYEISNTALLYELGSNGINIEANPNLLEEFKKERKHDINICCGIGSKDSECMPFI